MREYTVKIGAGTSEEIKVVGDYVRLKTASVAVRIESPDKGEFASIQEGDALNLSAFERIRISHSDAAEQTVTVLIGNGTSADSSKVGGSVAVLPTQAASAAMHDAVTVTNASGVILAANANRKYLLVQNRSLTGTVYINLNGATATTGTGGNGIELLPKSSYESNSAWVSTADIMAIGSIASNPDVLIIEGE